MIIDILLFSIPEAFVVAWLVVVLAGVELPWFKVASVGVLTGISIALLRLLVNSLFLNMACFAGAIIFFIWIFRGKDIWKVAVSAGVSLAIYILIESISVFVIQAAFPLNLGIANILVLKFVSFLPQLLVMMAISFFFSRAGVRLFADDYLDEGM